MASPVSESVPPNDDDLDSAPQPSGPVASVAPQALIPQAVPQAVPSTVPSAVSQAGTLSTGAGIVPSQTLPPLNPYLETLAPLQPAPGVAAAVQGPAPVQPATSLLSHMTSHMPIMAPTHTSHLMDVFSQFTNMMQTAVQSPTTQQTASDELAPAASPSLSPSLPQAPPPIAMPSQLPLAPPNPSSVDTLAAAINNNPLADLTFETLQAGGMTNGHVSVGFTNLGPTNPSLKDFLLRWARLELSLPKQKCPATPKSTGIYQVLTSDVNEVTYEGLHGDDFDLQGISWTTMGVTRREARVHRDKTYKNYCTNKSDAWKPHPSQVMPQNTETYFRFKKFKIREAGYLAHFQLRNLLAAPSRSRVLYADKKGVVRQYDAVTGKTSTALKFPSSARGRTMITTIAAGEGLVVAGGLEGEYCTATIDPVYGGGEVVDQHSSHGYTHLHSGISNHIQVHSRRSGGSPVAALASNDSHLRLLDLATQKVVSDVAFAFPVNCTAVSPDRRMRVVVGDDKLAYIVAAEHAHSSPSSSSSLSSSSSSSSSSSPSSSSSSAKPDILQTLGGHRDFGFACAWADDGYTLATGYQDRAIKIWDARKTCDASGIWTPVATLRSAMASVRSLHFSPAGSGKRVLVAAEEADVISIIDAQTFQKRQAFDLFGELAGVGLTDNGQDLFALYTDPERGGLLHLQRSGIMSSAVCFDETPHPTRPGFSRYDWPEPGDPNARQRSRNMRRRLRTAATFNLEPF